MTPAERVLAEGRVDFWDVERWLGRHPVYLRPPDDVIALVLEERGIRRESIRFVYPALDAASLDYVVLYEPVALDDKKEE